MSNVTRTLAIVLGAILLPGVAVSQTAPSIRGLVVNTAGRPLAGVEIVLAGVPRTVATNAVGRFVFDSLDVREYALTARLLGYRTARAQVPARADPPTEVEIILDLYSQQLDSVVVEGSRRGLYGVVGNAAKQPIPGAKVEVYVGVKSQLTDSTGRFAYPDIKPGDYVVSATADGLVGKPMHVNVPRDGSTELASI